MRAGALDRLVELRHRVLTRNETTGEEVESYPAAYAEVWASKRDIRGREFFAAQQMNSELSTTWQIRYRDDVLMTDRIYFGGLAYEITSVAEIGRRSGLELQTTAVKP